MFIKLKGFLYNTPLINGSKLSNIISLNQSGAIPMPIIGMNNKIIPVLSYQVTFGSFRYSGFFTVPINMMPITRKRNTAVTTIAEITITVATRVNISSFWNAPTKMFISATNPLNPGKPK